jgi:hypothetical protein
MIISGTPFLGKLSLSTGFPAVEKAKGRPVLPAASNFSTD